MLESDILHTAVEYLENLTQVPIEIVMSQGSNGHQWDALIVIRTRTAEGRFNVHVIENVLPSTLHRLADKLKGAETLLVAKYISKHKDIFPIRSGCFELLGVLFPSPDDVFARFYHSMR